MEFAWRILSSILSKIGEYLVDSIKHRANYLLCFKNIVDDLKKEEGNLRSTRDDVQYEVERAKRNTEEIEKRVENWLTDVQNVLEEIQRLEDDMQVKKSFLCGWCPNWGWRYKLSKRAVEMMNETVKLQDSGKFDRVSHFTTLPGVEGPKDFISFKPTEYAFSQIIEALKNDKINMVGLYGKGGVGKTTLAKVVGKEAKQKKLFDEVVMVTVTQNPNVKNIQGQIAESLNLKLNEEIVERRAQRLCSRLKNKRKTLLILDDVWEKLDLTIIGIPYGDDHKVCKLLLTTRQQHVCIRMGCQSRIQLDVLNEEEGLILFRKHVCMYNDSPPLNDVVTEVVGECRGLPIAIITIGNALREKTIDDWKDVSKKLKMSKFTDIEAVDQNVYACLKLSYDFLKAEETKFFFLLCSLFPEDYEIDLEELLEYGLGLGLYRDANSIEEARTQLRVTINNLKASCLLLDAKEGFVKMHDLVRDVALWITSKVGNVFMVKAGMRLKEWPKHQGLEQCTAISLLGTRIEVLPDGLVCPKLKILLLDGNNVEISDEFFEEMKTLEVASLSWIVLSVKSLQFLTNLVTLQLINCRLSDISSIKKLAKLVILRLEGYGIVELPEELGELSKLRMLDIRNCRKLKRIPAKVIPRLSRLEELYIGKNSFKAWEVEGTSAERSNASLSELYQLNHLTILTFNITVQPRLPKDFVLPTNLLRYEISVNDGDVGASYPKSRILKIRGIEVTSLFAFKVLCKNVQYLKLMGIEGCCQNIIPNIDETGLNELKRLDLKNFDDLECIIDTMKQQDVASTAFSNLVDLSLDSVGLREICSGGRPPRGFLENLETLNIRSCGSMSCLFPSWMLIQSLRKLKKVTVNSTCGELEDVFQLEGLCYAKENPFLLSTLESLHLDWLQNLRYIWKGPTQQVSLQSLTVVEVKWCNKLRYLFTLSLARSLLQLEQLKVWRCGSLEHIVEIKEAEENVGGGGNDIMFPKLRKLRLGELKNCINFCSQNYSSTWPALQELTLYLPLNSTTSFVAQLKANVLQTSKERLRVLEVGISDQLCNTVLAQLIHGFRNLEKLKIRDPRVQVLSQLEISLPSLKVLYLYQLQELECLCKGPTHLLSLPNLKRLEVFNCDRLRHMFSPSLARNFMQLEELIISWCGELEEIFNEDDAAEYNQTLLKDHLQWRLLFPNLSSIFIRRCDKLKSLFPVSIAHHLSLQNLTTLQLDTCHGLTHLVSSTTLVRNLLRLESIDIKDCGELEQIIVEDHTKEDHVQPGLFPNLSSISVNGCGKLKTLFPFNITQLGLQKLRTISVEKSFQLEELFGHKDEADMTSHREMVLPQLQQLSLEQLASLVNFCPVGYHFIFPSLSWLVVIECPKLTTRFSIDKNRSVHAEAKAPQTAKEDVDMELSPPKTTRDIKCWDYDSLRKRLPPYIGI
ncbi:hypothetical protein Ddye_026855 [Dipteronia dyeriana]|uniref:AAA+ ATPase domain-containing protein n=1 Tax=Dipteronia dyeriana TaxID=168575 RepID=A0AAD9WQX4_9ROSI|nr:hypothetical protein Ddye_026855 [Dipteronia dyeriana]